MATTGGESPDDHVRLVVHTSHSPMAFMFAATGPRVEINGIPTNLDWGQAPFDLPAGDYDVRICTRYLGEFGSARLPVRLDPGQVTTVYYRPPPMIGRKGSIGLAPVRTRGMTTFMWVQIAIVLIIVIIVLVVD